MPIEQCNTCGSFDAAVPCEHCSTILCSRCQGRHAPYCEMAQRIKKSGGGFTVNGMPQSEHRHGHETPPTTPPDRRMEKPAVLGAPYKMEPDWKKKVGETTVDSSGNVWVNAGKHAPLTPVDMGIEAVKDLLEE